MRLKDSHLLTTSQSNANCLKLLPSLSSPSKPSKLIIGTSCGHLLFHDFSLPTPEYFRQSENKEITRVAIGGVRIDKRDTVFYAAGAFIKSVDAKGKALIGFDWNST
jgi:hypothetical protein